MNDHIESVKMVSRVVDRINHHGSTASFQLSNGIVLTIKTVPPFLIQAVQNEFHMPDPPKVMIEEKGREEENPNDPTYLREIERLSLAQKLATDDLYLAVGTAIKSIPSGYFKPEEDDWIDQVQFAAQISGVNIQVERENKTQRYLHWLKLYACETTSDAVWAASLPSQLGGIREGEVDEVLESFRGVQERGSDTEREAPTGSSNGNTANRASRRRGV